MKSIKGMIYVHWPYCAKRCTYCNFNKYIPKKSEDYKAIERRMRTCLKKELNTMIKTSGFSQVKSVFFGGGTPSLMSPKTVEEILDTVKKLCSVPDNFEVTLEANPKDLYVNRTLLNDFIQSGISRVSIGIQSFSDSSLKMLNRDHNSMEAFDALEQSVTLLPKSTSADLIFGLPGQSLHNLIQDIQHLTSGFALKHLSLYELTIERGTKLFKDIQGGALAKPDEDMMAEMYETAVDLLQRQGLHRYEISNFAVRGRESVHNRGYWKGFEYIGVGPGAHSRFKPRNLINDDDANTRSIDILMQREVTKNEQNACRQARIQTLEPDQWMLEVERVGHGTRKIVNLNESDVLKELLITSLRTREGLSLTSLKPDQTQAVLRARDESDVIRDFIEEELVHIDETSLRLTSKGLNIADYITSFFLSHI